MEPEQQLKEIAQTIGWEPGEKTLVQAVKDEWHDFMMVVRHCAEVYGAASGNLISKPNTLPGEVIRAMEDRENADIAEAVREAVESLERELVLGDVLYRAQGGTVVMKSDEQQAIALLSSKGFQDFMGNYVAGFASQDGGVLELAHALAKAVSGPVKAIRERLS